MRRLCGYLFGCIVDGGFIRSRKVRSTLASAQLCSASEALRVRRPGHVNGDGTEDAQAHRLLKFKPFRSDGGQGLEIDQMRVKIPVDADLSGVLL